MTPRIGCREAVARLWHYLDHELDTIGHQAVEDHLALCMRCCGELAFAKEVRGLLARQAAWLPDDVHTRLQAVIDDLDPRGDAGAGTPA